MNWEYILFDLDGTLTDSSLGIITCVKYALEWKGCSIPEDERLFEYIGPPLVESFQEINGMSPDEAESAVKKFRERYDVKGLYENSPYEGIEDVLKALAENGYKLAIATSKPEQTANRVLEHFGLHKYFINICGSDYEVDRDSKESVIREVLRRLDVSDEERERILMVGDRKHDIEGAAACGIKSLGVYYGFAGEGELEESGADYIINNVSDYYDFFNIER